ncbi:MAG: peptidoglycan-binding protein [Anaerolineaceae bacterium]|nr:peptidoglycan-binding protein [Anaerolineaceae bacterium]
MKFRFLGITFLLLLITSCSSPKQQPTELQNVETTENNFTKRSDLPSSFDKIPSATNQPSATPILAPPGSTPIPLPGSGNWEISPDTVEYVNLLFENIPSFVGSINHIAWSPDGSILVVAGRQGLILLNGDDLSILSSLNNEQSYFHVAFSPNGELLSASRYPYIVDIWDIKSGKLIISLENSGQKTFFSPSSNEVAIVLDDLEDNDSTGAAKTYIQIFDTKTWNQTITLTTITNIPYWTMQFPETIGVFFSLDGQRIQAVNILGDVRIWNTKTGALLNSSINSHTRERLTNGLCATSLSMTNEFFLSCMIQFLDPPCTEDVPGCNPIPKTRYDISIWDTNQLKRNRSLIIYDPPGFFLDTIYDSQSKKLVLNENEQIFFLDLSKNIKQINTYDEFLEKTDQLRFGNCVNCPYGVMAYKWKNNQPILALAKNGIIELWNVSENKLIYSFKNDTFYPTSVNFGTISGLPSIALGYSDGKIQIIDLTTGSSLHEIKVGEIIIRDIQISSNGKYLYSIENDYNLKKWNLLSLEKESGFPIELARPKLVSNSGNSLLAYSKYDNSIGKNQLYLVDINTNEVVRKIQTQVKNLAFSQDGNWIATIDQDISLWDVDSGELLRVFPMQTSEESVGLDLSPDASYIAINTDATFNLWDVNTNAAFPYISPHGAAASLTFSPSGCLLVMGDNGGWIHIMDLNTKEIISAWQAHGSKIQHLAFSQDGRLLLSQSDRGITRVWGQARAHLLPTGKPADISCKIALPPQTSTPVTPTATSTPVTPTPTPTFVSFFRTLTLADPPVQGADVFQMQQRLYALGYMEVGIPDGIFGKKTDQAVRNFQEKNGLVVDGIVGPITWNILFSVSAIQN